MEGGRESGGFLVEAVFVYDLDLKVTQHHFQHHLLASEIPAPYLDPWQESLWGGICTSLKNIICHKEIMFGSRILLFFVLFLLLPPSLPFPPFFSPPNDMWTYSLRNMLEPDMKTP